jgi:hypothetical protein
MLTYDYKGIAIEVVCEIEDNARQAGNQSRTRLSRVTRVYVTFFTDFTLEDGNLSDLAFVKSCTQYFIQSYWRHKNKQSSRIDLAKGLARDSLEGFCYSLCFTARQKNSQHYLHVDLLENDRSVSETYLDIQEVIMLDCALGKALNLLSPDPFLSQSPTSRS